MENDLKTLLQIVWNHADWRKIAKQRSKYDIFAHRVKAAAYQPTVSRFLEKLCHSLSLQSAPVKASLLKRLEKNREQVLKALRQETIYYIMLATED